MLSFMSCLAVFFFFFWVESGIYNACKMRKQMTSLPKITHSSHKISSFALTAVVYDVIILSSVTLAESVTERSAMIILWP